MNVYDLQRYMDRTMQIMLDMGDTNRTMRYGELGRKIGLVGSDGWKAHHRHEIGRVLYAIAALDGYAGGGRIFNESDFARFVRDDGEPGAGLHRKARITVE